MIARSLVQGARCRALGARWMLLAVCCLALAVTVSAQAPITNAKLDMRSAAQGVDPIVRAVAATKMPAWVGYRLAAVPGTRRACYTGAKVMLEAPGEFYVLARLEAGDVIRVRAFTPECDIDAGGLPLVWLTDLKPADGVAWLVQLARSSSNRDVKKQAVLALTRASDPAATRFFDELLNGR